MYEYRAYITKVYDGDTVTADIDLGFGVELKGQKLRLAGVNAPEVRGSEREKGLESRDWLREKILLETVYLKTMKDSKGKYGRWICEIYRNSEKKYSVNSQLVELGLAEQMDY